MFLVISSAWVCEYMSQHGQKPGALERKRKQKFTLIIYPLSSMTFKILSYLALSMENSKYYIRYLKNSEVKVYHLDNFFQQMYIQSKPEVYIHCKIYIHVYRESICVCMCV